MPFPVSISFSSNSFPHRNPSAMPPSSNSPQKPRRNPAISSGVKRARPRGLWKARGSGPRPSSSLTAPPPPASAESLHRRIASEFDSDSDRASCSSTILLHKRLRGLSGSDTPLSTDLDTPPHARPLVTKHHLAEDYFSAIPQQDDSSDDDSTHWTTRTKVMDISSTAGPGEPAPSDSDFTYEDWLDLKQLFNKACEHYESDDVAETLPLLRGVIHECHRCLLAFQDPSLLFTLPAALAPQPKVLQPKTSTTPGPSSRRMRGLPSDPVDLPTSFHSLLGTALFYFANSIAAKPELALAGEPSNPVPYWIAALDIFEGGENLPSRIEPPANPPAYKSYKFGTVPDDSPPPIREDWRMAIMWGRTLVALATEMVDRNRGKPPPDPEPQYFPSPFPTNTDYLKTGTIWDDEPEWPAESPFGVIAARRPPITRRMTLNNATPHEILQFAMDHFSRGIFHLPHSSTSVSSTYPSPRRSTIPQFARTKTLYEVGDEVLLLAEKLDDAEERKEWATYADSVLSQIFVKHSHRHQEPTPAPTSSPRDTDEVPPTVGDGMVAKARGRAWLVIGSTISEIIEERMDEGSETGRTVGSLMQSEEAEEARDALARAIEFLERAKSYVGEHTWVGEEEEGAEEDNEDDVMVVDGDDDADDEQDTEASMSARARGKQRHDSRAEETRRASRLEAKRASQAEAQKLRQQEAEDEKKQLSNLLAEALCSLANLTESGERQEEYYRRAEAEMGTKLFSDEDEDDDDDDSMDEDH